MNSKQCSTFFKMKKEKETPTPACIKKTQKAVRLQ